MIINKIKNGFVFLAFVFSLSFFCYVHAQPAEQAVALSKKDKYQLNVDKVALETERIKKENDLIKQDLTRIQTEKTAAKERITTSDVTSELLDKASLDLVLASANRDSAIIAKTEAKQSVEETNVRIRYLESELKDTAMSGGKTSDLKPILEDLQTKLNYERNLLKVKQQKFEAISKTNELHKQILDAVQDWQSFLEYMEQQKQQKTRKRELKIKLEQLTVLQQYWQNKLDVLSKQVQSFDGKSTPKSKTREQLKLDVLEAQERSNLLHLELVLARLENKVRTISDAEISFLPLAEVENLLNQAKVFSDEINNIRKLMEQKVETLETHKKTELQNRENGIISAKDLQSGRALINELLSTYKKKLDQLAKLNVEIEQEQKDLEQQLSQALSRRQGLPGFSLEKWLSLGQKVIEMPTLALQSASNMLEQVKISFSQYGLWHVLAALAAVLAWAGLWYRLRSRLYGFVKKIERVKQSLSRTVIAIISRLLLSMSIDALVIVGLFLIFSFSGIPSNYSLSIMQFMLVWLVFRSAIVLTRLVLLETVLETTERDVKLYKQLKWTLLIGGGLTFLTLLAHQLPVEYVVSDFFNRLFMLFLLITAILLLLGWRVVPLLFERHMQSVRPYLMRIVRLLSLLIPLAILATAFIGLLGYVDLAWTISKFLGLFLLVLTTYLLVRGLYSDFIEWLSELLIRRLHHGWLWQQAVLKPLEKVVRVLMVIAAIITLFMLYGWHSQSYVVSKLREFLTLRLIVVEGTIITPLGIIEFVISAGVLIWIARWTREFSYRCLFARTPDVGLRNSLAVFTQYTVVAIGLLIALKMIGIDFTALSYIATALAIGIGFGLRDLAKNYVCGMLLLIERPLRRGDFVTMGGFEGEVTDIGMRSITVKTWDNMEVLVPNSEAFEKPCTNWTHQDSIIRTVITIKLSRDDNPLRVQRLLEDVLRSSEDVVSNPAFEVFLKEISDTLIEIEVRYFINLQAGRSRPFVRSAILAKIWQCFEEHGIKAPHPQQDVHVRTMPLPLA